MTRKQKYETYIRAAKLIRLGFECNCFDACSVIGMPNGYWINEIFNQRIYSPSIEMTQDLRETILLSCAELVRLKFEKEK